MGHGQGHGGMEAWKQFIGREQKGFGVRGGRMRCHGESGSGEREWERESVCD